jgi:hypothetical protein
MKNTLLTAITGETLVLLTGVTDTVVPAPEEVQNVGQLIIQVIIGIITVWKLLKKPKEPKK